MNKKVYQQPSLRMMKTKIESHLLQGTGVHDDDPQSPGAALSRGSNVWFDDEEEEEE